VTPNSPFELLMYFDSSLHTQRSNIFLDRQVPGHWTDCHLPVEWPLRSPDLTPLEGHGVPGENTKYGPPKRKHYRSMCHMKPGVLKRVCHKWERHILMCYQCNGAYKKHVL